jgi:hypothetical protein
MILELLYYIDKDLNIHGEAGSAGLSCYLLNAGESGTRPCLIGITHYKSPRHWAALQLQDDVRTQPARIVQTVWKDRNVFFLRRALLRIVDGWEHLCPDSGPCPVRFSDQEIALHAHEEENRAHVSEVLSLFRENWGLPPDGSIESVRFDEVQSKLAQMRDAFVGAAGNEEDGILAEKLWPYQDTTDN